MSFAIRPTLLALLAGAALLSACDSDLPGPTAGVLTATLVSPNGAEGAAYLKVFGEGILEVRAADARTFSHTRGDTVNVVVVLDPPGELRFLVAVADMSKRPVVAVLEVAGGDDRLRPDLQSYRVELRP